MAGFGVAPNQAERLRLGRVAATAPRTAHAIPTLSVRQHSIERSVTVIALSWISLPVISNDEVQGDFAVRRVVRSRAGATSRRAVAVSVPTARVGQEEGR